jgi:uncharacterized RDD family membrane protein YckC
MTHNPYAPPSATVADISDPTREAPPSATNLSQRDYGGFWLRVLATLVDTVILTPIQLGVEYLLLGSIDMGATALNTLAMQMAISIGIWGIYDVAFWCSPWQATPGKRVCGLCVTTLDLTRLSFLHALGRYLAYAVTGMVVVGVLIVPFTQRRQALHDLLARTVVPKRDALRLQ